MADDFDEFIGQPARRSPAAFELLVKAIQDRIVKLRRLWTGREGRVIRVLPDGSGIGDEASPIDFGVDPLRGGLLTHYTMPAGNQSISSSTTGLELVSESATDVTWTYSGLAPKGSFLGWIQVGDGEITFAVNNGGELENADTHTKSAGPDSVGVMRVIRLNGAGKAVWKLMGETGT